jgi:hypothetical protein
MEKRLLFSIFAVVLFISAASAAGDASFLDVKHVDKSNVIISELNNPAVYDFIIKNNGARGFFEFYSFVGVSFIPKGAIELATGENKMEVKAFPNSLIRNKIEGLSSFEYQINY